MSSATSSVPPNDRLTLRELTESDEVAFLAAFREYAGEDIHWFSFDWQPGMDYREHLERLRKDRRGEDLPDGRVPHSMLYAFVGDVIVGRLSVRHMLNERLRRRGGHVGYSVAPKFRRRGYATEMLRQGLLVCSALGLSRVMATCDDDNEASWRVLEKCGARFEETFVDPESGQTCRRYWIELASAAA